MRTHGFAVSVFDDGAAIAAAVRAEHVAAVSAVVLSDEEREIGVAALAPEDGLVLNPTRSSIVLDCDKQIKGGSANYRHNSMKNQTPCALQLIRKPGMIHLWHGRVHTRKILGIGMAAKVRQH